MAIAEHPAVTHIDPDRITVDYDHAADALYVRLSDRPAVARHVEDEVWLWIDTQTQQVSGFFIEDFEGVFLKRYPDLAAAWHESRQPWRRNVRAVQQGFKSILWNWFQRENREASLSACTA